MSVAVTATVGVVTITGVLGGSSAGGRNNLSVQVKADLNQAAAALAALGFRSMPTANSSTASPNFGTDCAASATGEVSQFLARRPCKEYASAIMTAHRQGATAQVVITWTAMPTPTLARRYKAIADEPNRGNPPGQPPVFNGLCYASGLDGATVWTEQVQMTGHMKVNADRKILQAAAPEKLTPGYLQQHCVD